MDYLSIRQHRPYLASVYLVEFNQPAQATAAKLPQDVVERAKEMLRAVADTAEQIDRVAVPALPADEIELMLHMGGFRFDYVLNINARKIAVVSITLRAPA